jgi:hypothetical protein
MMKKLLAIAALAVGFMSMSGVEAIRLKNNNTGLAFTFTLVKKNGQGPFSVTIDNNSGMSDNSTHAIMRQSIEPGDQISITGVGAPFYDRQFRYDRASRAASELVSIGLWSNPNYSETKFVIQ